MATHPYRRRHTPIPPEVRAAVRARCAEMREQHEVLAAMSPAEADAALAAQGWCRGVRAVLVREIVRGRA